MKLFANIKITGDAHVIIFRVNVKLCVCVYVGCMLKLVTRPFTFPQVSIKRRVDQGFV